MIIQILLKLHHMALGWILVVEMWVLLIMGWETLLRGISILIRIIDLLIEVTLLEQTVLTSAILKFHTLLPLFILVTHLAVFICIRKSAIEQFMI